MGKVSDKHPELFHYTDCDGLKGILTSQNLRATRYDCLNDEEEIICFKKAIKNYSMPFVMKLMERLKKENIFDTHKLLNEHPMGNEASAFTDAIITLLYAKLLGDKFATPFIFSFCSAEANGYEAKNGLLSQWNRYGLKGGYALAFDAREIERLLDKEYETFTYARLEINEVVYSGNESTLAKELGVQLRVVSNLICDFIEKNIKHIKQKEMPEGAFDAFLQGISLYKHEGFKEENEVRIVAYHLDKLIFEEARSSRQETIREEKSSHSQTKNRKIHYLELFENLGNLNNLPIKRIIVGPSLDKKSRAEELKKFLDKRQIEVVVSQTPYI